MSELNGFQLKQLADFCSNLSLIFIATTVIAPIFADPYTIDLYTLTWGLALSGAFLLSSMLILKNTKHEY